MTKVEIKKALYKQKPVANFVRIRLGVAYYQTKLDGEFTVQFQIPVNDMGDADFEQTMEAKLLNRWIDDQ